MTTLFYQPCVSSAVSEFEALFRQMDEILDGASRSTAQPAEVPTWKPRASIEELGDRYEIRFHLAGIDPATLDIEASRDHLTVRGERKAPEDTPIHSEFRYGKFERRFRLPEEIQQEHISASYEQGVLALKLPKLTAAENYSVKVSLAGATEEAADPVW